jgi:hypothetical protein
MLPGEAEHDADVGVDTSRLALRQVSAVIVAESFASATHLRTMSSRY